MTSDTAISLRLPAAELAALDALVRAGTYPDRTSAIRAAIEEFVMAEAYARAYREQPQPPEEEAEAVASLRAAITEEPW